MSVSDFSDTAVSESTTTTTTTTTTTIPVQSKKRVRRGNTTSRSKQDTGFVLAYPPPKLRTKQRRFVQIRPRLVLQLRQLSPDRRPKPTIDVLATCVLAGTHAVPRLVRHVPAIFRAMRGSLGRDDLVVAKSEDYDAPSYGGSSKDGTAGEKEKDLDKRDWVAVISPLPPSRVRDRHHPVDRAEIVLADGAVWNAERRPNGSYQFVHVDARGETRTARWVKRGPKPGKPATTADAAAAARPGAECRFTFSMIDPSSRRHPVLATLTPSRLEISHSYNKPPLSSPRPSPLHSPRNAASPPAADPPSPPTSLPVDSAMRTLIMVTSVWVSLHAGHGWPAQAPKPPISSPPVNGAGSNRASDDRESSAVRPVTFPTLLRDAPRQSPASAVLPRRALSTGAAYMLRRQAKLEASKSATTKRNGAVAADAARRDETDDSKGPKDPGDLGVESPGRRSMCKRIRDWKIRIASSSSSSSSHSKKEGIGD